MKHLILICIIIGWILLGCVKHEAPVGPVVDKPEPVEVIVDNPHPVPIESAPPLSWEKGHPERKPWSDLTRTIAGQLLRDLDKAKDVSRFCPKYASLGAFDRVNFWAELVSVMAYFESGWKPTTVFKEPAPLNNESIGLLQLSVSDAKNYPFCAPIGSRAAIMDPLKNLDCGVRIMAKWVAKDGHITAPDNSGVGRYWSVVREKRKLPEVLAKLKGVSFCR
jgi:hypothetical protein